MFAGLFVVLEVKEMEFWPDVTVVYVLFRCVRNLVKEDGLPQNLNFSKGLFLRLSRRSTFIGRDVTYEQLTVCVTL